MNQEQLDAMIADVTARAERVKKIVDAGQEIKQAIDQVMNEENLIPNLARLGRLFGDWIDAQKGMLDADLAQLETARAMLDRQRQSVIISPQIYHQQPIKLR